MTILERGPFFGLLTVPLDEKYTRKNVKTERILKDTTLFFRVGKKGKVNFTRKVHLTNPQGRRKDFGVQSRNKGVTVPLHRPLPRKSERRQVERNRWWRHGDGSETGTVCLTEGYYAQTNLDQFTTTRQDPQGVFGLYHNPRKDDETMFTLRFRGNSHLEDRVPVSFVARVQIRIGWTPARQVIHIYVCTQTETHTGL